jgi:hypothetical protein
MSSIDLEAAAALIRAELPQWAIQHGWNVANLAANLDPDLGLIWSVELIGPHEVWEETHRFVGQREPQWTWTVQCESQGTIHGLSPESLAVDVDRWLRTVGVKR